MPFSASRLVIHSSQVLAGGDPRLLEHFRIIEVTKALVQVGHAVNLPVNGIGSKRRLAHLGAVFGISFDVWRQILRLAVLIARFITGPFPSARSGRSPVVARTAIFS